MGDDWLAEDDNIETSDPCDIGLVAYYPMDEGNGDTVADDTGDPCHEGTFSAEGVSWVTPGVAGGNCVHVFGDGSSPGARITIGDWNPAEGTGQLTLSMWVRWAGPRYPTGGQPQGLISKRGGWNEESVMFMLEMDTPDSEDTRGSFAFRPFSGDYAVWSEGGIMDVLIGRWAHLAATFDGTTSETAARLYLNGQEVASGQFAFGGGSGEDIYITIGNNNDSSWEDCPGVFNGDIDEVRFYNRALSGAEIAYLADLRTNPDDGKLHVEILSNAELYAEEDEGERIINFYDYARLLEHWLEEVEWQP